MAAALFSAAKAPASSATDAPPIAAYSGAEGISREDRACAEADSAGIAHATSMLSIIFFMFYYCFAIELLELIPSPLTLT